MLRELSIAICTMGSAENRAKNRIIKQNRLTAKSFISCENVFLPLTIFRKRKLEHRGNEEGQRAFGVVNFSAALAEPTRLRLVSYLIETTVLSCHEDAAQVCRGDGQDVGVVCRD